MSVRLRFDLNVSLVLADVPPLERFDLAARLGFDTIELWWPVGLRVDDVVRRIRDAGLGVATINFYGGDPAKGDRGLMNDPHRASEFRANVPVAVEMAQRLGCPNLTAIVGKSRAGEERDAQLARAAENLAFAAAEAAAAGRTVVVEALNGLDNPGFMLTGTAETLAFIRSVGAANVRYQLDLFHMQRMGEPLQEVIRESSPLLGHIQIADCPGRHQPGTGTMDWPALFGTIERIGYRGFVGLEYVPLGPVEESLSWVSRYRR